MFVTVLGNLYDGVIYSNAGKFEPLNAHLYEDGIAY